MKMKNQPRGQPTRTDVRTPTTVEVINVYEPEPIPLNAQIVDPQANTTDTAEVESADVDTNELVDQPQNAQILKLPDDREVVAVDPVKKLSGVNLELMKLKEAYARGDSGVVERLIEIDPHKFGKLYEEHMYEKNPLETMPPPLYAG